MRSIIRKEPGFDDPDKLAQNILVWIGKMGIVEAHLARGGAYVAGASFSLADIAITLGIAPLVRDPLRACCDACGRSLLQPYGATPGCRCLTAQGSAIIATAKPARQTGRALNI
ncbi:MAG: hypothetical protein MO846_09835 [Candidatus Devosia symbiotica]|nr:hypothetical protein [Candidatus Devosia symbiotica]